MGWLTRLYTLNRDRIKYTGKMLTAKWFFFIVFAPLKGWPKRKQLSNRGEKKKKKMGATQEKVHRDSKLDKTFRP